MIDQIRGGRWTTIVMDEGDDLPIGQRDCDAAVNRIIGPEDRPRKNGRTFADPARIAENIVLEAQPGSLIEDRELWRTVGEMEGIAVGYAGGRPPVGIFAPHKMAAIEVVIGI